MNGERHQARSWQAHSVKSGLWQLLVGSNKQRTVVTLADSTLQIAGHGSHSLAPASMFAVRVREHDFSDNVMGTVVVAQLDSGEPLKLLFSSILPPDLYFADQQMLPDLWFDPGAGVLLDLLTPYLSRTVGAAAQPPVNYAMKLRKRLLSFSDGADSLSIVGDTVAIGKDGAVVAMAAAHEIGFTCYRFERGEGSGPSLPDAPAVMMHFPKEKLDLSVGAHPVWLDDHFGEWSSHKHPDYLVGMGELMRLLEVLEAGRRRFAPG